MSFVPSATVLFCKSGSNFPNGSRPLHHISLRLENSNRQEFDNWLNMQFQLANYLKFSIIIELRDGSDRRALENPTSLYEKLVGFSNGVLIRFFKPDANDPYIFFNKEQLENFLAMKHPASESETQLSEPKLNFDLFSLIMAMAKTRKHETIGPSILKYFVDKTGIEIMRFLLKSRADNKSQAYITESLNNYPDYITYNGGKNFYKSAINRMFNAADEVINNFKFSQPDENNEKYQKLRHSVLLKYDIANEKWEQGKIKAKKYLPFQHFLTASEESPGIDRVLNIQLNKGTKEYPEKLILFIYEGYVDFSDNEKEIKPASFARILDFSNTNSPITIDLHKTFKLTPGIYTYAIATEGTLRAIIGEQSEENYPEISDYDTITEMFHYAPDVFPAPEGYTYTVNIKGQIRLTRDERVSDLSF